MVLTVLTLNVNSLGCQEKLAKVWSEVLHTDIICFQETHLQSTNEFVFPLGAQGYDFFLFAWYYQLCWSLHCCQEVSWC